MGFISEFKDFAMKGNVMDLAVGVIIGGAFGKIVTSLVENVLMPIIGVVSGGADFTKMAYTLGSKEVTAEDGSKVIWNTHGHNPSALRRRGWVRDTLNPGDKISMSGDPTFDGSPKMFIRVVTMDDGTVLENKAGE